MSIGQLSAVQYVDGLKIGITIKLSSATGGFHYIINSLLIQTLNFGG